MTARGGKTDVLAHSLATCALGYPGKRVAVIGPDLAPVMGLVRRELGDAGATWQEGLEPYGDDGRCWRAWVEVVAA